MPWGKFLVAAAVLLKKCKIANHIGTVTSGVSSASVFFFASRLCTVLILISLLQPSVYFVHVGSLSSDAVLVFKSL